MNHIPSMDRYHTEKAQGYGGTYDDYVQEHYEAKLSQDRRAGHQSPSPEQYENMVALANDAKGF